MHPFPSAYALIDVGAPSLCSCWVIVTRSLHIRYTIVMKRTQTEIKDPYPTPKGSDEVRRRITRKTCKTRLLEPVPCATCPARTWGACTAAHRNQKA